MCGRDSFVWFVARGEPNVCAQNSDLRRWGLKLAERGGKNGKKRAIIATVRKSAVLLHRLSAAPTV